MDESEHHSVEGEPSPPKAGRQDELVVKGAGILRNARPKLNRLIVIARPRAHAAGQEALRYVRKHEGEIKQTAAKLARVRLRGPLGLVVDALIHDSSPAEQRRGTKCPHCGMMNMPVAKFCNECGIRLTSENPDND